MRASKLLVPVVVALAATLASPAWAAPAKVDVVARSLDAAPPRVRRARRPLRRRGGPWRLRPVLHRRRGPACMGATGAVTEIDRRGHQFRIVQGLASFANTARPEPDGRYAQPDRAARHHRPRRRSGLRHQRRADRAQGRHGAASRATRSPRRTRPPISSADCCWIGHHGPIRSIADLWAFERDVNPDADGRQPGGRLQPGRRLFDRGRFVVADAGGNAIDPASSFGRVTNLAVFANRAVPESVRRGRTSRCRPCRRRSSRGRTTSTTSASSPASRSRPAARTSTASIRARAPDGLRERLHEHHGPRVRARRDAVRARDLPQRSAQTGADGAIFAVSRDGTKRQIALPPGTLTAPGGITVGQDGLYVSNQTFVPGEGQVLRIRPR